MGDEALIRAVCGKERRSKLMKILALESSALVSSAAICEDTRVLASLTLENGHTHSETLLPMAERLLSFCGLSVQDIDLFAVPTGPGSFTGVRIGVSLLKGLAFGSNKPCAGVSSLEALAYNMEGMVGILCPVMDARRSQLYNALFLSDGKTVTRLTPDRLIPAEKLLQELECYAEKGDLIYINGEGIPVLLDTNDGTLPLLTPAPIAQRQTAVSVARLALMRYQEGMTVTDEILLPTYLRPSQAERERIEREGAGG